jgi:hypothetical protein
MHSKKSATKKSAIQTLDRAAPAAPRRQVVTTTSSDGRRLMAETLVQVAHGEIATKEADRIARELRTHHTRVESARQRGPKVGAPVAGPKPRVTN